MDLDDDIDYMDIDNIDDINNKNINDIYKNINENINDIYKNIKYVCKRCGYEGIQKQHLKAHLQRKNECESILAKIDRKILLQELEKKKFTLNCIKCDKLLSTRQNKWKHEKICKFVKVDETQKNINEELKELKDSNKEIKELIKEFIKNNTVNNFKNSRTCL
jgi:hypothetical protein